MGSPSLFSRLYSDRVRVFRTVNLYLSFFSLGLTMSISGPTLPDVEKNVDATSTDMGYVLASRFVGACAGCALGGWLFGRFNRQFLFSLGLLIIGLTSLSVPFIRHVPLLVVAIFLNGLLAGGVDTGGNVLCLDLWMENPAPFYQALHFSFGVGSVAGPLIAEPFLSPEDSNSTVNSTSVHSEKGGESRIEVAYSIVCSLVFMSFVSNLVSFFYNRSEVRSNTEKKRDSDYVSKAILPRILVALGIAFLFAYMFFESSFTQFLTTFVVVSDLKLTKSDGSFMTSVFWGTNTVIRGCSIYASTKVKLMYVLAFNITVMCSAGVILTIWGDSHPAVMWLGTAMLGLGSATMIPSGVAWLETYVGVSNLVGALFFISTSVAASASSLFVGYIMDYQPKYFLYNICLCSGLCACIFAAELKLVSLIKKESKGSNRSSMSDSLANN